VESEVGKGSMFTVVLPLVAPVLDEGAIMRNLNLI